MSRKEIRAEEQSLKKLETLTEEQKARREELSLRSMIMSCLTYGEDIFTAKNYVNCFDEYYNRPYADEYIDVLGYEKVMEIYNDQKAYFERGKVEKAVYTDSEGVVYNRFVEEEC